MKPPFIHRVTIRNYKSIAACQVDLTGLMFLVGPNGSGKSNFLDALRFVADALRSYEVQAEECRLDNEEALGPSPHFHVRSGKVESASFAPTPATLPDRLFLVAASGVPEFRPVFDDEPVRLELRGNCRADLAGWRFRLVRLEPIPAWAEPVDLDGFATEQSGEAGDILADQMLRHYDCPVIEETPLGVLCYHKDDGEEPWDHSLQAELDQEAERIDRAIRDSLDNPPENDDTSE